MPDFTKRLGYGGSAVVDGIQVLITAGNMEQTDTPSFLEMMDIDPTVTSDKMDSRSRVQHADGVSAFAGSISFDLTKKIMDKFTVSKLLARGYQFNVGICDGTGGDSSTDVKWTMKDCYLTNATLTGAPGGLIAATIAYVAKEARNDTDAVANDYILDDYYGTSPATDNQPTGYWWSGGTDVKEWTLTMNQAVEPVYLNEDVMTPKYLRVGLIDYQLDVVLYDSGTPSVINIRTSSFTLTGKTTAIGYTFNGITDLGMYSHSFVTAVGAAGNYKSDGVIIT
jgi:hypothetical protein